MSDNLETNQEQGSFSSGILVGFLVGAVGYFLSQTKEGKEFREKFSNHWFKFRNDLIKEGKLSEVENDVADYISAARAKISEFLGDYLEEKNSTKKISKKKTKPRRKKVFKGI